LIIGSKKCNEIFEDASPASVNRGLRGALRPLLKKGSRRDRIRIARWIVRDWGGIRRGIETVDTWVDSLGDFSLDRLNKFSQNMAFKRISSWSKILAFAEPNHHAIFDARVAASLNCCLVAIRAKYGFFQPSSQNRVIQQVHRRFMPHAYSYFDYLGLLKAVVRTQKATSILEAEMILFAGAVRLVERFTSPADGMKRG
jgi:hypothetical protein